MIFIFITAQFPHENTHCISLCIPYKYSKIIHVPYSNFATELLPLENPCCLCGNVASNEYSYRATLRMVTVFVYITCVHQLFSIQYKTEHTSERTLVVHRHSKNYLVVKEKAQNIHRETLIRETERTIRSKRENKLIFFSFFLFFIVIIAKVTKP